MKNTPSTRRFCLYILVMIFVCATNRGRISATLSERSENPVASTSLPYAVRGQLIVKYKDTVTGCVHCIVRKGLSISHSVAGEGNGLEDLHSRYGVYFAKPVFRTTEEEERMFGTSHVSTDSLKQYHRNKLDLHRSRFPGIAGRSSAGSTFPDLHHIYLLKLSENADVSGAVEEFSADPNVAYAQPDYVAEITLNPNDKYFRSSGSWGQRYDDLWALKQNQLNLGPAWDITQGDGVVVGVVDTGLDYNHKDIAGNVWSNPGEIDGNNIDDDGNGLVDDHRGYDFTTCQAVTRDGCLSPKDADNDPFDGHFHGTHVSGTIAATGGNRRGIIGVAPRAKILPVKGLNDRGQGQLSELAAALVYAASNGADVINNSWSCGFCPRNPLGEDAVQTAHKLGVVVVFSAGNNATNVRGRSPQNSKRFKPVVVAASNQKNQPTSFTNFGSTVDVTAPGGGTRGNDLSNILSLAPQPCDECPKKLLVDEEYLRLAGTSMSAPHVSGLAALILAHKPGLKNEEVRQVLRSSAADLGKPGFDLINGAGRIQGPQALNQTDLLNVSIGKPLHLSGLSPRSLSIQGTVAGPGLNSYQLSLLAENQKDWIPVGGPKSAAVNNGNLGTIPRENLPLGWHTVKLEATSQAGAKFSDVVDFAIHLPTNKIRTNPPRTSHNPDISGNLIVFPQDVEEGLTSHLFVFDLSTKKKTRITKEPIDFPWTRIEGNVIAWLVDFGELRKDGIFYCKYNARTGECPVKKISSNTNTGFPSVSEKHIVWEEFIEEDEKDAIFLYDISSGEKQHIGEGTNPTISGNDVVWKLVYPGRLSADLIHYNIRTGKQTQLTNSFASELDPEISGRKVAYLRPHIISPNKPPHLDIYLYDLDTGKETKLVEDPEGFGHMDFSDNTVVWKHTDLEVHSYDLQTGLIQRVSFFPLTAHNSPRVSGKTVAWTVRDPAKPLNGDVHYLRLP